MSVIQEFAAEHKKGLIAIAVIAGILGLLALIPPPPQEPTAPWVLALLQGHDAARDQQRSEGSAPSASPVDFHVVGPVLVVDLTSRAVNEGVENALPPELQTRTPDDAALLVWTDQNFRVVGHYAEGSAAERYAVDLTYVALNQPGQTKNPTTSPSPTQSPPAGETVLSEAEVLGSEPPSYTTGGTRIGDDVDDEDVAKAITDWIAATPTASP